MRERTLAITFTSLLAISLRAHAEGLVADRFSPAVTGGGYITVERPDTLGDLRFQVGLLSTYAASPLRVVAGPFSSPVIDGSLATTVAASLGVRSFLELGLSVPAVLYQTGPGATTAAALGDIQVHMKARALSLTHFGLGFLGSFYLPTATGGDGSYAGLSRVAFAPRVLLEARGGRVRGAINAGVLLRPTTTAGDMTLSHELTYAAALGVRPVRMLELLAELRGSTALTQPFVARNESPAEAGGAVAVHLGNFVVTAGGGAGIVNGFGAPTWRVLAALRYERPGSPPLSGIARRPEPPPRPKLAAAPPPAAPAQAEPEPPAIAPPEPPPAPAPVAVEQAPHPVQVTASQVVPREAVYFDTNRARVRRRFGKILDAVAQVLKEHPELGYIRVEGHADATGLPAWNKVLSRWRAQMVRKELIARGVPADRLGIIGFGDKSPIADNDSETGRKRNRRVVFFHHSGALAKRPGGPG